MRIAVLSDIHGNVGALQAVVADFTARTVDAVVNLGDSLSGPLLPLETAQFLMAQDWVQLRGNHERQVLALPAPDDDPSDVYARGRLGTTERAWIAALPHCRAFSDDILLCHGTPARDDEFFLESLAPGRLRAASAAEVTARLGDVAAAVIVCGHSHVPRIMRSARGQLLVNPGSVGQPAWDDQLPVFHSVENGAPDARYAIVEGRGGRWSAELIAVPYDHEAMAALALEHGRPDWAHILRHGYVPAPESTGDKTPG